MVEAKPAQAVEVVSGRKPPTPTVEATAWFDTTGCGAPEVVPMDC